MKKISREFIPGASTVGQQAQGELLLADLYCAPARTYIILTCIAHTHSCLNKFYNHVRYQNSAIAAIILSTSSVHPIIRT